MVIICTRSERADAVRISGSVAILVVVDDHIEHLGRQPCHRFQRVKPELRMLPHEGKLFGIELAGLFQDAQRDSRFADGLDNIPKRTYQEQIVSGVVLKTWRRSEGRCGRGRPWPRPLSLVERREAPHPCVIGCACRAPMRSRNVLLIYPRFATGTFWNYRATCEVVGRRCPAPPLGLITMAALLPSEWKVRLVDCNAQELTDDDLAWADLAMTGGMLVQQRETLAIIRRCHSRGLRVAVGGPDAT